MHMHTIVKKRTVGFLIVSSSPALVLHNTVLQKSLQNIMLYFKKSSYRYPSAAILIQAQPQSVQAPYLTENLTPVNIPITHNASFSTINYQPELGVISFTQIYSHSLYVVHALYQAVCCLLHVEHVLLVIAHCVATAHALYVVVAFLFCV